MPPKLSAVIITYNEEKKLRPCLESVTFSDEVVVVDSHSTDATPQIASEFKTVFRQRSFDDFSNQKNFAMDQASGDWLFFIDADERISPELRSQVLQAIQDPNAADGYYISRINHVFGAPLKRGASGGDWQLRLLKKGKGIFTGTIHERIQLSHPTGRLSGPLIHETFQNLEDYFKRFVLYTTLESKKIYQEGKRPTSFHVFVKPFLEFIYFYLFRFGFLDGKRGLQYQILSSFYTYVKYTKALELFQGHEDMHG